MPLIWFSLALAGGDVNGAMTGAVKFFDDLQQSASLGGGWYWNSLLGYCYGESHPFAYTSEAEEWLWIAGEDVRESTGYFFYRFGRGHWGWSASKYYPWYLGFPSQQWRKMKDDSSGDLVLVEGGPLPSSSDLGEVAVSTFYIGKYEVTWGEWKAVRSWATANGYDLGTRGAGCADNHPVHSVNWYDVVKWCNAKSQQEGLTSVYTVDGATFKSGEPSDTTIAQNLSASGYRLPTEAEWEFAARGGNQTHGFTYSGSNDLDSIGWYWDNTNGAVCDLDSGRGTWPIGQKGANELGLHDMSGNIWEWCWDETSGNFGRHSRGGSYLSGLVPVSDRRYTPPSDWDGYGDYGFRLARSSGEALGGHLVLIEGGTLPASSPLGAVVVQTFHIGRIEVMNCEWETVRVWAAANGYDIPHGAGCRDAHPANVSWFDVVKWCNAKSQQDGLTPVYTVSGATYKSGEPSHTTIQQNLSASGYRLPTEAEWEFASRGGNQTHGYTYSGSNDMNAVGWFWNNSGGATCDLKSGHGTWSVRRKSANELGLFDMSGNVWEWCWDQYDSNRRIRGGSWLNGAYNCSVSYRHFRNPDYASYDVGFRLARSSGQ